MQSSSNVARGLDARGPRGPEMRRQTPRTVSQESLAIGAARGHLAPPGSTLTRSALLLVRAMLLDQWRLTPLPSSPSGAWGNLCGALRPKTGQMVFVRLLACVGPF